MQETGHIAFLRKNENWGKLSNPNIKTGVYFNFEDLVEEAKHIVGSNKFKDEPFTYDAVDSIRKVGEKQAKNISLDKAHRRVGYVIAFEPETGRGRIEDFDTKEKITFHVANLKRELGKEDKFIRVEPDDAVIFSINVTETSKHAKDIVIVDNRYPLEYFAVFENFTESLKALNALAEKENDWDYIKNPKRNMPILFSYINHTFKRIEYQNKIVTGRSKQGVEYAYFNTGLVNPQQDEIYAYFVKNPNYKPLSGWGITIPQWKFLEFNTEESNYRKYFNEEPRIATYFEEAQVADLIFNTTIRVIPDRDHLIKRKNRIETISIRTLDDDDFVEAVKESINLALKRIKRNYKAAIPHFYDNKIQFLLPLCFKSNKALAVGALVVNQNENIYEAHTILSLDQALNNARLLAKPDREWLNP